MPLFAPSDRPFCTTLAELAYCNPFLPRRTELERQALGSDFDDRYAQWNVERDVAAEQPNLARLLERTEQILQRVRTSGRDWRTATAEERTTYEDLVLFAAYHRLRGPFSRAAGEARKFDARRKLYEPLSAAIVEYVGDAERAEPLLAQLPHLTAIFFQLGRAFHHIFDFLLGASRPIVELRAAAWQSIFTHDMRRYRRLLFDRLGDFAVLITGPSGTGKELVARAIGLSRYVPYDTASGRFADDGVASFLPLNLSALSPTLIESELFGHCRGAFTGASEHREGWLERCSPSGTVFLDEIGELAPTIQVKLLRVLQERTFQRLGEAEERTFRGKLISATNRDLAGRMRDGEFRDDLYYRLCSDLISTPSLRRRLDDDPGELRRLVLSILQSMIDDRQDSVCDEVLKVIAARLGPDYAWPGNVRELEQCVRNVLIRRDYAPPRPTSIEPPRARERLSREFTAAQLSADEMLRRYCTLSYAETGNYEATAARLSLDRRTVKAKIDAELLAELRGNQPQDATSQ